MSDPIAKELIQLARRNALRIHSLPKEEHEAAYVFIERELAKLLEFAPLTDVARRRYVEQQMKMVRALVLAIDVSGGACKA